MSASGDSGGGAAAPASSHAALADLLLRWLEAEGILQPAWQRAVAAAASGDDAVLTLEVDGMHLTCQHPALGAAVVTRTSAAAAAVEAAVNARLRLRSGGGGGAHGAAAAASNDADDEAPPRMRVAIKLVRAPLPLNSPTGVAELLAQRHLAAASAAPPPPVPVSITGVVCAVSAPTQRVHSRRHACARCGGAVDVIEACCGAGGAGDGDDDARTCGACGAHVLPGTDGEDLSGRIMLATQLLWVCDISSALTGALATSVNYGAGRRPAIVTVEGDLVGVCLSGDVVHVIGAAALVADAPPAGGGTAAAGSAAAVAPFGARVHVRASSASAAAPPQTLLWLARPLPSTAPGVVARMCGAPLQCLADLLAGALGGGGGAGGAGGALGANVALALLLSAAAVGTRTTSGGGAQISVMLVREPHCPRALRVLREAAHLLSSHSLTLGAAACGDSAVLPTCRVAAGGCGGNSAPLNPDGSAPRVLHASALQLAGRGVAVVDFDTLPAKPRRQLLDVLAGRAPLAPASASAASDARGLPAAAPPPTATVWAAAPPAEALCEAALFGGGGGGGFGGGGAPGRPGKHATPAGDAFDVALRFGGGGGGDGGEEEDVAALMAGILGDGGRPSPSASRDAARERACAELLRCVLSHAAAAPPPPLGDGARQLLSSYYVALRQAGVPLRQPAAFLASLARLAAASARVCRRREAAAAPDAALAVLLTDASLRLKLGAAHEDVLGLPCGLDACGGGSSGGGGHFGGGRGLDAQLELLGGLMRRALKQFGGGGGDGGGAGGSGPEGFGTLDQQEEE